MTDTTPSRDLTRDNDLTRDEVLAKHAAYLLGAVANYYVDPVVLASGDGTRLTDVDGNTYLDFFGGILTVSIGQCDERVTGPLKAQIDRLGHVSTLYPTMPIVELAERMARITPGRLQKSFFTASGTEADETAVALAQVYTESLELIALRHGYSGRSMLAQSLTAHSTWRAVPTQVAGIKHARAPYCYRCPMKLDSKSCGMACVEDLREVIRTTTTGRVAGFLAEPIQGVGGFVVPPQDYFRQAVEIVREHGGVFICDEVQTGFGRTGGKMFGIEHFGVEPEIMTMAKGVANGMPLGVTIAIPEIADAFQTLSVSTFGGNPMSSTAAIATIDVIESEDLVTNAQVQGDRLRAGLEAIQAKYPKHLGDVRGMGLMQAIEFVADETIRDRTPSPETTGRVFEAAKARGLLVGKGGLDGNVLRIAPALTVTADEIDEALVVLDAACATL